MTMDQNDAIPVFYCFARSGGTLLNQCLGITEGNLVLSEVNPHISCRSIEQQAHEWLGLLTSDERVVFSRLPYAQKIRQLHDRARSQKTQLILRDWCTVNFLARTAADETEPSGVLEQPFYLSTVGLTPRALVFTRRASAVYASIRENFPQLHKLDLNEFAEAYLEYARAVADLPIFKLEDFTVNPTEVMAAIAERLGVPVAKDFKKRYRNFQHCTGNNLIWPPPRSLKAESINPRVEKQRQSDSLANAQHPKLGEADSIFGYAS